MRPIEKWDVGHTYDNNEIVKAYYNPYRNAKSVLVENLGSYCSYCEKAFPNLKKYEAGDLTIDLILDMVKSRGGWSIWYTVFRGHEEVLKALIDDIPGTCKSCFDAENHYIPIGRNPGSPDPV